MANPLYNLLFIPLLIAPAIQFQQCETDDDDDSTYTHYDVTPGEYRDCSDLTREFWVYDFTQMPPRMTTLTATCRVEGAFAYIYVADDQWEDTVFLDDALLLLDKMESETPEGSIHPETGFVQNDMEVFGEIPDALDNDPKFYILAYGMAEYVSDEGNVYSFDGYFGNYDQYTEEEVQRETFGFYHSNELEIIYINTAKQPITTDYMVAVVAHELQHLIEWNYDESEESWISESLAEVAMLVNGYYTDSAWVENYASWPGYPLIYPNSPHYGACLLWGMYLYEQVGLDFLQPLEEEQLDGIDGLNRAFLNYGSSENFLYLFKDWVIANVVDEPDTLRYGYQFTEIPDFARVALLTLPGDAYDSALYAFGVDYLDIELEADSTATLELQTDDPDYSFGRLIRWEAGVMADFTELSPSGTDNSVQVELVADSPDVMWTLAVSYTDRSMADGSTQMSYGVRLVE